MSSETLSQNEIDLLFNGGEGGGADVATQDQGHEVQIYDFRRPARISKDRQRSLSAMYGLLAKSIESWLTGRVRDSVELDLQSVEQLTFGEFMLALPSPCSSYIMDVGNTGHQGVIDIGHEFGFFLVDRLLGGAGRAEVPERNLSHIERLVVRVVAERVAHQLADVWKDHVRMDLNVSGFESIPEMLQVARREDPVLVANIGVTMGELSSLLLLCLPFPVLEKYFITNTHRRALSGQGTPEERSEDRARIETTVRSARLRIGARLPTFEVPLGKLLSLQPGQILTTTLPKESELELYVAGQRRFVGSPGRIGRKLAVRVAEAVKPEPEDLIKAEREAHP